jgi:hypothetical protein
LTDGESIDGKPLALGHVGCASRLSHERILRLKYDLYVLFMQFIREPVQSSLEQRQTIFDASLKK